MKFYFLILFFLFSCSHKSNKIILGKDEQVLSGVMYPDCGKPLKRYANNLDLKVKLILDSLLTTPLTDLNIELSKKVVLMTDYTSEGLDLDLILYRVCELANNRRLSNADIKELVKLSIETWESKKK